VPSREECHTLQLKVELPPTYQNKCRERWVSVLSVISLRTLFHFREFFFKALLFTIIYNLIYKHKNLIVLKVKLIIPLKTFSKFF